MAAFSQHPSYWVEWLQFPLRREEAEAYLTGKQISEEVAKTAADLALEDADPFEKNTYKVDIAKSMIKNSLIQMGE